MEESAYLTEFPYQKPNPSGSCWTCLSIKTRCGRELPECQQCVLSGRACAGYASRLQWPKVKGAIRRPSQSRIRAVTNNPGEKRSERYPPTRPSTIASPLSTYGVPIHESHLLQHYTRNMARIALAIDYHGNIYRSFLATATCNAALLNSILAASAAHLNRWQNTPDFSSARYAKLALVGLEKNLRDPLLASSEATLATILCLISFEAGNGSTKWRHHYEGLKGWLQWRGDTAKLDPFLKSWVIMAAYQAANVFGEEPIPAIRQWLEIDDEPGASFEQVVDPFLGYSVKLPRLLLKAASLQEAHRTLTMSEDGIRYSASQLQQEIAACKLDRTKPILLASACQATKLSTAANTSLCESDLWKRVGATAEIFRHAAHIYVHRIGARSRESLPEEIQLSVDEILGLLNLIPDTRGPGSNLAWPLFTVGLELDSPEQRDMVLDRWQSLHLLGMESTKKTERVLVETWRCHDEAKQGRGITTSWQEVMRGLGGGQMIA